jgi:UDP-N-acetyl-D-mannosaminuronic acid transferase (WecB/TagA/CpsF family)
MTETLRLLRETDIAALDICLATGIGVDWISRFRNGRMLDPGVNRVEALHRYLAVRVLVLGGDDRG